MILREPRDEMSGQQGRPGFYARGTAKPGEAADGSPEEWAGEMVEVIKARVVEVISGRPEDLRLLLRSAEMLLRAARAGRHLSGRKEKDIAQNIQRVLESLGSQLLPADYPGAPPPDTT